MERPHLAASDLAEVLICRRKFLISASRKKILLFFEKKTFPM